MARRHKCPECGVDMGNGYDSGDTCSDCYEIDDAANEILHHIDKMYPAMWTGVASTARTSIKNTIKSEIRARFL